MKNKHKSQDISTAVAQGILIAVGLLFALYFVGKEVTSRFEDGGKDINDVTNELKENLRAVEIAHCKNPSEAVKPDCKNFR